MVCRLTGRLSRTFFSQLPRAAAAAGADCGAPSGAAGAPTLGVCVRASVGRLAEGMPWQGGWVAELRRVMDGRRGWVDRDLATVTTWSRNVYSRLAEQECVCARARPHVDSRVAENKYGNFLACLQHPTLAEFFLTGGLLLGREVI